MKLTLLSAMAAAILTFSLLLPSAQADDSAKKIDEAASVLTDIMAIPEKGIPPTLLNDGYGVAIFPGVIKLGFIVGGRYGSGVLLVRDKEGNWTPPAFVSITGGSIGWQVGAQSTDVILVFKSRRSVDGIMNGKFTLGADAAVAAGPVGRSVEAATDVKLQAEIYSYSRSRGLFAGVSLGGASLQIDDDANAAFYAQDTRAADILSGKVQNDTPTVENLQALLMEYATP